jgi:hypothetical protein
MAPKGPARLVAPLMRRQVQRQEDETMERFKSWAESSSRSSM